MSEALALSVELRSSLGVLPEDAGWEAPVVPPVVPIVPLEKFLLELLGPMLGGAPVSVELGSAVPALIQHSPESMLKHRRWDASGISRRSPAQSCFLLCSALP